MLNKISKKLLCVIAVSIVSLFSNSSFSAQLESLTFVEGKTQNAFVSGGNIDTTDTAPKSNDSSLLLLSSTIGSPFPNTLGWVNPNATAGQPKNAAESLLSEGQVHLAALQDLFSKYYKNDDPATPDSIYLSYDFFLYDATKDDIQYAADGQHFSGDKTVTTNLFDPTEAEDAKQAIFTALKLNPLMSVDINGTDVYVANLLLDISYYESVSNIMKGNLALEKAYSVRFLEGLQNTNQAIFNELKELGWNTSNGGSFDDTYGAWAHFNKASKVWFDLIKSPIQRDILKTWAAVRDLDYLSHPAFAGGLETTDQTVFDGYKDAAAIYKSLAQRAKILNEVASRLVLTLKRDEAAEIIADQALQLAIEDSFWFELFFENGLPSDHESKYPGLASSLSDLKGNLTNVAKLRSVALNPDLNGLGFDKDVLYIRAQEAGQTDFIPTFAWFQSILSDQNSNSKGALLTSELADQNAQEVRKTFLHKALDYLNQYESISNDYNDRLISIMGDDGAGKPNRTSPQTGGGLLEQQLRNIDVSKNDIERVSIQIENIYASIKIEQNRMFNNNLVNDKRIKMINKTGSEVGVLQQEMANIQGDMAFASSMASAASGGSSSWLDGGAAVGAHIANAFIQKSLHRQLGKKQKAITRLQTEKEASFVYFSQEQAANDSAALIQNKFLDIRVLQIDLLNAQLRFASEVDRLAGYYDQIDSFSNQQTLAELRLQQKNFVDPTFRIEVTNAALEAESKFQQLQNWIYLMLRSLEYKWPLTGEGLDSDINTFKQKVVQARTAKELKDLIASEMKGYDDVLSFNQSFYYSSFSLKEDYLGLTKGNESSTATELFVDHLKAMQSDSSNIVVLSNQQYLAVNFSTVKFNLSQPNSLPSQTDVDVQGANSTTTETALAQPLFSGELWDNKISWVQVNIDGNQVYSFDPQKMPIQLWYGGTGYLRTKNAFCKTSSDDQGLTESKLIDYRDYPKPAYEFSLSNGALNWLAKNHIKQQVSAKLVSNPRNIPDYVFQANAFAERPVASSDWRILLPLDGLNIDNIRDIELSVVSKARTVDRPSTPTCNI